MNLTLHLTEQCNMACSYCTRTQRSARMSDEVLLAACDLAFSVGKTAGLCFFGGEPLLEQDAIRRALTYCAQKSKITGKPFACKMTTNGTLLTPEFLELAIRHRMGIGLSFDGLGQAFSRRFRDGSSSMERVTEAAKLLLDAMPDSYALLTLAPEVVEGYADSVRFLRELGFRNISGTPAYGTRAHWTDGKLSILREQLEQLAQDYEERFYRGERFYFSQFDAKIRECISGQNPAERCHLGFRQMPVNVDGKLYPCTQFVGDAAYCLGDVFTGIDRNAQMALARRTAMPESCRDCALNHRCTNSCGCLNRLETGNENMVSPLQCSYERMLIEISDALAERMFAGDPARFLKRFGSALKK